MIDIFNEKKKITKVLDGSKFVIQVSVCYLSQKLNLTAWSMHQFKLNSMQCTKVDVFKVFREKKGASAIVMAGYKIGARFPLFIYVTELTINMTIKQKM